MMASTAVTDCIRVFIILSAAEMSVYQVGMVRTLYKKDLSLNVLLKFIFCCLVLYCFLFTFRPVFFENEYTKFLIRQIFTIKLRYFSHCFSKEKNIILTNNKFDLIQLMSFLVQFDENRVRMSATGLFKVGQHLIPSVSNLLLLRFSAASFPC